MLSGAFSTTIFQKLSIEGLGRASCNFYDQDTLRRPLRESATDRKRAQGYITKVRVGLQVHRFPDNKEFRPTLRVRKKPSARNYRAEVKTAAA